MGGEREQGTLGRESVVLQCTALCLCRLLFSVAMQVRECVVFSVAMQVRECVVFSVAMQVRECAVCLPGE